MITTVREYAIKYGIKALDGKEILLSKNTPYDGEKYKQKPIIKIRQDDEYTNPENYFRLVAEYIRKEDNRVLCEWVYPSYFIFEDETECERLKARNEALQISDYIKNWQIENPFNSFKNLDESNSKFKKDFNEFLNSGDFSESTKNIFLTN